jgi:N-acetylglutamate synthase-like GNAT family acetyltransferase
MIVRKATGEDMPYVSRIAWRLALDYPGMEDDTFFVAEERGKIIGILGLREYGDFLEMLSVGVLEEFRKMGVGRKLVEEALKQLGGRQIYLMTSIPDFYGALGFKKVNKFPEAIKKDPAWCVGCNQNKCTVMFRIA